MRGPFLVGCIQDRLVSRDPVIVPLSFFDCEFGFPLNLKAIRPCFVRICLHAQGETPATAVLTGGYRGDPLRVSVTTMRTHVG